MLVVHTSCRVLHSDEQAHLIFISLSYICVEISWKGWFKDMNTTKEGCTLSTWTECINGCFAQIRASSTVDLWSSLLPIFISACKLGWVCIESPCGFPPCRCSKTHHVPVSAAEQGTGVTLVGAHRHEWIRGLHSHLFIGLSQSLAFGIKKSDRMVKLSRDGSTCYVMPRFLIHNVIKCVHSWHCSFG